MANENVSSVIMENRTEVIQIDLSKYYNIIVPIFISACLATFMLNVLIIVSYPLIRNLNRVSVLIQLLPKLCRQIK